MRQTPSFWISLPCGVERPLYPVGRFHCDELGACSPECTAVSRAGALKPGLWAGISVASARVHKARHTAGQRVLDATGSLKAAQKLLGHSSIQTTRDIYADWDINRARDDDG